MKKDGRGFSVTVWSAIALGAVGIGVIVAFVAGFFLGHFTGHENTTTISAVTAPSAESAASRESSSAGEEKGASERESGSKGEEEAEAKSKAGGAKSGSGEKASAGANVTAGKTAFTSNCSSCHTLSEAGTSGTVGPNLDELEPEKSLVEKQVTNGGAVMPAFGGTLSKEEIENIAEYVSEVAGTGNDTLGGKSTGGGGGV